MVACLKGQLGGNEGEAISDANLMAKSFKRDEFRNFVKANTDLYGTSAEVRIAGGTDMSGFATNVLCLGVEELDWKQVKYMVRGMVYEFFVCDLNWYEVGCTGSNGPTRR